MINLIAIFLLFICDTSFASYIKAGTAANNIVQLNSSAQLPAVSGALLTNLPVQSTNVVSGFVNTQENTASTTFTDLTTVGPSATITVPASGVVTITYGVAFAQQAQITTFAPCAISFAVSGANTISSSTNATNGLTAQGIFIAISTGSVLSSTAYMSGLTPGSTTFKLQYEASSNSSCNFSGRYLIARPEP